jgi:hypothetical protein
MKNQTQADRMTAYNYAKWYGKRTGQFETGRVDRALSYLMSGKAEPAWEKYQTTLRDCGCPDRQGAVADEHGDIKASWKGVQFCKHMIAQMIDRKIASIARGRNIGLNVDDADDPVTSQAVEDLVVEKAKAMFGQPAPDGGPMPEDEQRDEIRRRGRAASEALFGPDPTPRPSAALRKWWPDADQADPPDKEAR